MNNFKNTTTENWSIIGGEVYKLKKGLSIYGFLDEWIRVKSEEILKLKADRDALLEACKDLKDQVMHFDKHFGATAGMMASLNSVNEAIKQAEGGTK